MTIAIRVFYRKSDNQIVWIHSLEGTGKFPLTIEQELAAIPEIIPSGTTPLGGVPQDYGCIEETDPQRVSAFLASDSNQIVNGVLIIGDPRPIIITPDSPDVITLKQYLTDPHSGLPDLETAFQALARLFLRI